jgi:hypothetical protein
VLLREGQFGRHPVEAVGQTLKLIPRLNGDAVIEKSGSDPLSPLLEKADRLSHPVRQRIGKQAREDGADEEKPCGPPQGCVDGSESFG